MASTPAPPSSPVPIPVDGGIKKKPAAKKHNFILFDHTSDDKKVLGKFVSTNYKQAALKAVTKLCKHKIGEKVELHLRKATTKDVQVFVGEKIVMSEPKVVERGGRTITYKTTSVATFLRKYTIGETPEEVQASIAEEMVRVDKKG
jgi:hypothetical protein